MDIIQAIVLGLVQGATEFIPVSSSAHLVIVPWALGWHSLTQDQALLFYVILHWGTAVAVITYFRSDLWRLATAWLRTLPQVLKARRLENIDARLAWWVVLGTIPAVILAALFNHFLESLFSSVQAVGVFLVVTAILLTTGERLGHRTRDLTQLNLVDALLIGLAQAVAMAPGISRSGATMSMGLFRGLQREAAARFSFLLSIPVIIGAGIFEMKPLAEGPVTMPPFSMLIAGFVAAAISGYLCIRFLLRYLRNGRLYIFAGYCAIVGLAVLLAVALH